MKLKILVTGASGFIGRKFVEKAASITDAEIITTSFTRAGDTTVKVDLADADQVKQMLASVSPTHVFHFAAMVNPKMNEEKKLDSFRKNFIITNNLINVCNEQTKFYFLSTDKVYDPADRNASEDDDTLVPGGFYALMKLVCEKIIAGRFEKHLILRCPIIHSTGEAVSNSFIDNALLQLAKGQPVQAFTNVVRHYLLADELIDFLIDSIDLPHYGTYNIGSEPASYINRISAIASQKGLDLGLLSGGTGNVDPEVQTYDLSKFRNTFKKTFK